MNIFKEFSMRLQHGKLLISLFIFTAASSTPNKVDAFIAGAKATGMASTGVAYPQDAYAGAYNPAGIIEVGNRIDIGFEWSHDNCRGKVNATHPPAIQRMNDKFIENRDSNIYLGDFGVNLNFSKKTPPSECAKWAWNWAIGIVGYNQDYWKTSYKKAIPLLGKTKASMEYIHEIISPVASLRLIDGHTLGISLDIHIQSLKVNGVQQFALKNFSLFPENVTNRGRDYSSGIGASIGWQWQAYDCLAFGVVYRSKAHMSRFKKYKGFLAEKGRLDTPERWSLGLAYQILNCAIFTFDFEWINWHSIKPLHNNLLHHGRFEKNGSSLGPGFGFRNQKLYRVGIAYDYNDCWTFRAGFRHSNSFIRNEETVMNLLTCDTMENYLTLGATYHRNSNELSFFYAHGFESKIKGHRSIPASLGSGNVTLSNNRDILGISWGYSF